MTSTSSVRTYQDPLNEPTRSMPEMPLQKWPSKVNRLNALCLEAV
jgi:hypothetical protein